MKRRILLADDSVTIQKVIELTFLDEDYDVKAVSNGDEAIAALPQVNPDFVIADVHMPGANGYEVCRRSKETRPDVPVLLLVGTFEPFDEAQSRAVGADSFLKKPFDSQELLQRVEDLLAARGPAASASAFSAPAPASSGGDLLGMPSLSELPPLDLGPSPSDYSPPATDWGSFQLEPSPAPASADPFPPPLPPTSFQMTPMEEDQPYAPRGTSSYDDSPFVLDEEPREPRTAGGLQVDESALLPAGEPMFELDATDHGLRAGEFGDATPMADAPSYDAPSYDAPSAFAPPPFDPAPPSESPSYGASSYDPAPFDPAPVLETPSFDTPSFSTPSFDTPSYETPAFETPSSGTETRRIEASEIGGYGGFETTPEERLGVPQSAVPLVDSRDETEARIAAPPPVSFAASHEPESTGSTAATAPAPLTVGTVTPAAVPPAATNGGGHLSDEDVDRIARRVVELMADRAIRDVAWEVIPDMAEVVIRDRLRELESQAESFE